MVWQFRTRLPWLPSVVRDLLVTEPIDESQHFAGWLYCELESSAAVYELRVRNKGRGR